MGKNRILIVEEDAVVFMTGEADAALGHVTLRIRHPVQDCGIPVFAHKRGTQVLLSPRFSERADLYASRLRVVTAIAMILLVAFGAGAAM